MPQKLLVNLLYPSINRRVPIKTSVRLGDRFRSDRDKIDVLLRPELAWNSGREVFIDAERGVEVTYRHKKVDTKAPSGEQVSYPGLGEWVGVDGRYTYASKTGQDSRELQTRGLDFSKYVWPAAITFLGILAGFVILAAFAVGK